MFLLVNQSNLVGNCPLHYACFWRANDIAMFFAKGSGAIVKVENNFKKLPYHQTSAILKESLMGIEIS
jgi:ankyrin repeat protein